MLVYKENYKMSEDKSTDVEFEQMLKNAKNKLWCKNIKECIVAAKTKKKWLINKIEKHIERTGSDISIDECCQNIQDNKLLASFFCKNPKKQNLSENIQYEFLEKIGLDIKKYNEKLGGRIKYKIKTIDALINDKYTYMKHIDDSGGAQDNQYDDLTNFVKEMAIRKNSCYIVISGTYFTKKKIKDLEMSWDEIINEENADEENAETLDLPKLTIINLNAKCKDVKKIIANSL